jgi:NNP family nitrate/nitrite transporter-like MFS transporter
VPTLVGAVLRLPYTFAVAKFGGRNWTIVSAALLLIPTILAAIVMHPGTSYTTFMVVACFAGLGGGNFASSMTNINAFFPERYKGWALGLNGGGGNIGVPVISHRTVGDRDGRQHGAELVCAIYLVLIALAAAGAALFMDNLRNQKSNLGRWRRRCATSTLGDELPVHRHVRIVHRFLVRLRSGTQINFLAGGDGAAQAAARHRSRSSGRCWAPSPAVRRQARRRADP